MDYPARDDRTWPLILLLVSNILQPHLGHADDIGVRLAKSSSLLGPVPSQRTAAQAQRT
jgi:hypothetical protein